MEEKLCVPCCFVYGFVVVLYFGGGKKKKAAIGGLVDLLDAAGKE